MQLEPVGSRLVTMFRPPRRTLTCSRPRTSRPFEVPFAALKEPMNCPHRGLCRSQIKVLPCSKSRSLILGPRGTKSRCTESGRLCRDHPCIRISLWTVKSFTNRSRTWERSMRVSTRTAKAAIRWVAPAGPVAATAAAIPSVLAPAATVVHAARAAAVVGAPA